MFELAWRDAIEHRMVWIGAVVVAAATSLFTCLCLNALFSASIADTSSFTDPGGREMLLQMSGNMVVLSGLPAVLILATVLGTLCTQTGAVHALWRLAGASPQQVLRIFTIQVVLACLCGGFIGAIAALPFQGSANALMSRNTVDNLTASPGLLTIPAILLSMVVVSVWGIIAGLRPAIRASRLSPLVSREPDQIEPPRCISLIPATLFLVFILLPMLVAPVLIATGASREEFEGDPAVLSTILILPAGWAVVITLAFFAPLYLGRFMQFWTALPGLSQWTPWR